MSKDVKYFKGLDGIRAIAAFGVLFSHLNLRRPDFGLSFKETIDLGGFGVTIFFALSGFLITYLLMKEKHSTQTINVKYFYIRRILRIWPLYFFYLGIAVITLIIQHKHISSNIGFYIIIFGNIPFILNATMDNIGHLWSIGVEEQFYLFWPWLLKKSRSVLKAVIYFTAFYVILRFAFRIVEIIYDIHLPYIAIHVTRFDCMGIGAIGALLFYTENQLFNKIACNIFTQITVWFVIVLLFINKFHIASVIDHEIVSVLTVFMIINVSQNPRSIIKLDNSLFNFLGSISYGIYIYHPLMIALAIGMLHNFSWSESGKLFFIYGAIPIATVFVAYCSYSLIEKPFLKLKTKFVLE